MLTDSRKKRNRLFIAQLQFITVLKSSTLIYWCNGSSWHQQWQTGRSILL